ncbi:MAG: ATP-dependent RNA helicase HrpA [Lentisphaeria bacterium]|nr:ATP-dependent RNA helicase HrpA [Lentisphaeria bacterium]
MSDSPVQTPLPEEELQLRFPAALPVSGRISEICELWRKHQVIMLGGDTGSGKTTQLPKAAALLGCRHVGITQPRRIAAVAMARRVAEECGTECGKGVGYQVRFDNNVSPETRIKFMTDGILLAETRNDRQLRKYDAIIIDEAHERSLNIDFLLGYLKDLLPRRPDLKVAISSATMDLEHFSEFFGNAPIIQVEGRMYPVEDHFQEPLPDEDLPEQVARAVEFVSSLDRRGDILVFLPGEREIRECADMLEGRKYPATEILPLFARLSNAEQQKVFRPGRLRRIVLATNVAETSITIPGIRFCVDSGLARVSRYNPRSRIQELHVETISQASARQRRGRCGRTADGVCVHLYTAEDLAKAEAYTDPEIKRTSLAGVILQMAVLRLPRIDHFPFPDPPQSSLIREGLRHLEDLGAMLPGGRLTREGWRLADLPIDPHIGKMLLEASRRNVLHDMLPLAAFLSIQDPAERPYDRQQQADEAHRKFQDETSDYMGILKLWRLFRTEAQSNSLMRRFAKANFMNFNRLREWRNLEADLRESCKDAGCTLPDIVPETVDADNIHKSILSGVPRQIAKYVPEYRFYMGAGGKKYVLFPGSGLSKRKKPAAWIVSFALVETARLFGRRNAEIQPEWVNEVAPHLCTAVYENINWDKNTGFVHAHERLISGNLILHSGKRVHYGATHPVEAREIFIRDALAAAELPENFPGWVGKQMRMVRDLRYLEVKLRRPGGVYDPELAVRHFQNVLPAEVLSVSSLKRFIQHSRRDLAMTPASASCPPDRPYDEKDYPDLLDFHGHSFLLQYLFEPGEPEDGIRLLCPKEELNLLPAWALDWPVPGHLEEKILLLIKQLPKEYRRQLSPASEHAAQFTEACRKGKVFTSQPLHDALRDHFGTAFPARVENEMRFPPYMKLRLAITGKDGKILAEHEEMPDRSMMGSRVSHSKIRAGELQPQTGLRDWPEGVSLPAAVQLGNTGERAAYPALAPGEDGLAAVQFYLREPEAALRHREGLVRLFEIRHADQMKFIRRSLRMPNQLLLAFFCRDAEKQYAADLPMQAVLQAFGMEPEEIRTPGAWREAEENAMQDVGAEAANLMKNLEKLHALYGPVHDMCRRLQVRPRVDSRDLRAHLDWLFAPGFLARPAVWSDYPRYLRGLRLRAERLDSNPAKDAEKLESLEEWLEKFRLAMESAGSFSNAPALYDFWLLLEECRLAVFAPEVPLKIRNPMKELPSAWENLRF